MNINVSYYILPKAGNSSQENEDAYCGPTPGILDGSAFILALADGATSSMLSKDWSKLITTLFANDVAPIQGEEILRRTSLSNKDWQEVYLEEIDKILSQATLEWKNWLLSYIQDRELRGKPIQWYEEDGLSAGAFSSLVQLRLFELPRGLGNYFETLAIGDSCFFLRRDKRIVAFPIEHSEDFNNQPTLFSSNPLANKNITEHIKLHRDLLQQDDRIYLMTDALAKWFLAEYEDQKQPWLLIDNLDTEEQYLPFDKWIDFLRTNGQIRNDDVALIRIDIFQ